VFVLFFLMVALFGFGYETDASTVTAPQAQPTQATRVPKVIGLTPRAASHRLAAKGLVPDKRWCGTHTGASVVVRQQPLGGTLVAHGTRVRLVLAPARFKGGRHTPCNAIAGPRP
jgi:beta-lactam-binding protein with PASTA domain